MSVCAQTLRLPAGNKAELQMEERCGPSSHTVPFRLTRAQRSTCSSGSFTTKTLYLSRAAMHQMLKSPRAPEIFFSFQLVFGLKFYVPLHGVCSPERTEFQSGFIPVHVKNIKELGEVSIYLSVLQSV